MIVVPPHIIVFFGPPDFPEIRPIFDAFQTAFSEDHQWLVLERDLMKALFGREEGGHPVMDDYLSHVAGQEIHVREYEVSCGQLRGYWLATLVLPLAGIETAGDRSVLRTGEFRTQLSACLGLVTFREWIFAMLVEVPTAEERLAS